MLLSGNNEVGLQVLRLHYWCPFSTQFVSITGHCATPHTLQSHGLQIAIFTQNFLSEQCRTFLNTQVNKLLASSFKLKVIKKCFVVPLTTQLFSQMNDKFLADCPD